MADYRDNPDGPIPTPDLDAASDLVEVYVADNDVAAMTAIAEILRPAGIWASQHDRRSHALFAPAAMPGHIGIAVRTTDADRARALLHQARQDGVLTDDGHVPDGGTYDG